MVTQDATLVGFVYGEQVDDTPPRSLGYRLLEPPASAAPWTAEVEALARALHATAYPDPWPPADLFCSVLLSSGERVVAVARYGLSDHTASRRRGGLELIGVVCPRDVGVEAALGVYRWLRERRARSEGPRVLSGTFQLRDILQTAPPAPPAGPASTLPVRLGQGGAFLFAAAAPSDPDARLGLLEGEGSPRWQWVPLCGSDFPVQTYAQRGPLVAWTPNVADLAIRLEGRPAAASTTPPSGRRTALALASLLALLLAANLYTLWTLPGRLVSEAPAAPAPKPEPIPAPAATATHPDRSRELFAAALHRLVTQGRPPGAEEKALLEHYQALVARDPGLMVESTEGRAAVGLVAVLGKNGPDRVARVIQEELTDQEFLKLLIERVRSRLIKDTTR